MLPERAALVVVDVQQGFDDPAWGQRNNPDAETRVATLLAAWREADWPLFHVHHDSQEADSPLRGDRPGFAPKPEAEPIDGESVIRKRVNSGFIGTDLEERLREAGVEAVVVCGLTTDHCVSTTSRMAENLGFETFVVRDATATFDRELDGEVIDAEANHRAALAQLSGEFATVVSTEELVAAVE